MPEEEAVPESKVVEPIDGEPLASKPSCSGDERAPPHDHPLSRQYRTTPNVLAYGSGMRQIHSRRLTGPASRPVLASTAGHRVSAGLTWRCQALKPRRRCQPACCRL